VFEEVQSETLW